MSILLVLIVVYLLCLHFGALYGEDYICHQSEYSDCEYKTRLDPALVACWKFATFLNQWSGALLALATVALVGFTATLWRSSDNLWREAKFQRRESRRAAFAGLIAARAARRSAIAAERSLEISVRPVVSATSVRLRQGAPHAITFDLVNFGDGPAILKGVQAHGTVGLEERVLFSFGSLSAFQSGDEGVTIEAGNEPFGPVEIRSDRLDDALIHSLTVDHHIQLAIRIVVQATDVLGNSTRHVNIFNWDHMRRGFIPATGLPKR